MTTTTPGAGRTLIETVDPATGRALQSYPVMDDDAVFSSALTADDIRGLLEA